MHNAIPLIVALCPEHAEEIARAGFDRRTVRAFIHAHARLPVCVPPASAIRCGRERLAR